MNSLTERLVEYWNRPSSCEPPNSAAYIVAASASLDYNGITGHYLEQADWL